MFFHPQTYTFFTHREPQIQKCIILNRKQLLRQFFFIKKIGILFRLASGVFIFTYTDVINICSKYRHVYIKHL